MIKKIIWYLILPLVVGVSIYFIFFKQKASDTTDEQNSDTQTSQEAGDESSTESNENGETSDGDEEVEAISGFSEDDQTVGEESSSTFTIEEIANTAHTEYHEFVFTLTSTGEDAPYVVASYKSNLGVIRVDLNQIEEDNSGIGYQEEVSIDNEGISRLYHNVSSDQTEELYDIGVNAETPFKLISEQDGDNWVVTIYVQYPGESSDSETDSGSTEFSSQAQSITGVGIDEGATVSSYTYGVSSNVLKFVWNVSSSNSNPIPNVNAAYDSENNLVLTFTSLKTDKVYLAVDGISLPGSLALQTERSSDTSIYTFSGFSSQHEYKLSASTSPNQVVLEIEL